jgi:hypothetical protein
MNCGRGRLLVLAAVVAASLVGVGAARAGVSTLADVDDVAGKLDIKSISEGHASHKRVTHTIRTFGAWGLGVIGPHTPNYFLLELSVDGDFAPERSVLVVANRGKLRAALFGPNSRFIAGLRATRPNRHSVRVFIPRRRLGNPAGYDWQAFSFFMAPGACADTCKDRTPDHHGRLPHDLRAPKISFPQPTAPTGPATDHDVIFSISDTGGSGLASWSLQHRHEDETAWTEVADESGPQTYHQVSAAGDVDQFRIVAVDGHGNRRVSPVRTVVVPPAA